MNNIQNDEKADKIQYEKQDDSKKKETDEKKKWFLEENGKLFIFI